MVSYAEPVVVNHVVLFCASGCESWCVMLSLWLKNIVIPNVAEKNILILVEGKK
jgi:hypothetical protein